MIIWRSMETAPKDGSWIIGYLFEDYPCIAYFDIEYDKWRKVDGDDFCSVDYWAEYNDPEGV